MTDDLELDNLFRQLEEASNAPISDDLAQKEPTKEPITAADPPPAEAPEIDIEDPAIPDTSAYIAPDIVGEADVEPENSIDLQPPVQLVSGDMPDSNVDDDTFFRKLLTNFEKDYNDAKVNIGADRRKLEAVANTLMNKLNDEKASVGETECLVTALSSLASSSGHYIQLLNAKSKLLAASKSLLGAVTGTNSVSDVELQQLLDND